MAGSTGVRKLRSSKYMVKAIFFRSILFNFYRQKGSISSSKDNLCDFLSYTRNFAEDDDAVKSERVKKRGGKSAVREKEKRRVIGRKSR